ncbi:MAG: diphosphomevalonate decarboxylase [Thermoanaerobaculia bacterium]|nr:diphosphomevalonate decarboxylase [Thermoanaerobaculia bacterium]
MPKTTIVSPSNIAFIKYWGATDLASAVPENASLSMTLRACHSRSTVEHVDRSGEHEIRWRGTDGGLETAPPAFAQRVREHLDRLLDWAGESGFFRVATENSFPAAAGLASSASGFSALTLAVLGALGRAESHAMQSELARRSGSGSASRSVLGGYVQWPAKALAPDGAKDYAFQVHPAEHWDLRNVVVIVETGAKETSSLEGHRRARTSPYFERRLRDLPGRLEAVRDALACRDFDRMGAIVEAEAVDLHCVAMTSAPPIYYWKPATLTVLEAVRGLRSAGVSAWATMDAGANVHVLCQPDDEDAVAATLGGLPGVDRLIRDGVGSGPFADDAHLF